jgi:pteridine reductase
MPDRKAAWVSGSGKRRVGWHVAMALAARGYAVAIHYHRSAIEATETVNFLRSRGADAAVFQADLSDENAVRSVFDRTLDQFGRLDVLVNCASTYQSKKLEEISAEDVRFSFETNTLSTFLCSQYAGLLMVRQPEGGNIILMGDWAVERPYLNYAAYLCSKGAIPTMTRCLAVEFGTRNPRVRVNCIMPGPVLLPPDMTAEERSHAIAGTIVKREGSPENIAQAVLSLIDNDFITGVCLPVDGGRTIYAAE